MELNNAMTIKYKIRGGRRNHVKVILKHFLYKKSNDFIQTEMYPLVTDKHERFSIGFFKNWSDHTKKLLCA